MSIIEPKSRVLKVSKLTALDMLVCIVCMFWSVEFFSF